MSMPALVVPPKRWTEEEFYAARDAAPAGERWEFVDGEVLVTPSPHWHHQGVAGELFALLRDYVRAQKLGRVFQAPLDLKLRAGLVMQPDVLVVPSDELKDEVYSVRRVLVAAECISPSSARFDRVVKRPHYQRNSIAEYWSFAAESATVERWQPQDDRPAIISEQLVWHPESANEPLVVDLPSFFRRAISKE